MHYLFINGLFPQYSQTFINDQIKAVRAQRVGGVSVFARSLASFRFENTSPESNQELIYAKPRDWKLLRRVALGILRYPARALRIEYLLITKRIDLATSLLAWQLPHAPDISITHFGSNYETGVQLKKYIFPMMRNVVVFHGHDISSYIQKYGWHKYKDAAAYIDCAICVNRIWANLLSANTKIKEVKTVYLGTTIRPAQRRRNGDDSAYSILFVGRFVEKKGFALLYEAVKNIKATGQNIRVHCVGDGPELAEFNDRAVIEGFCDIFVFYGAKQKRFVEQLMDECDVFIAPSRTAQNGDSEGLPVVLFEAMVAGIPVISTYHSGIPEAITNGTTGVLVPESDVDALETAIRFAIANPEALASMANRARKYVEHAHDEKKQVRAFLDAVKGLA